MDQLELLEDDFVLDDEPFEDDDTVSESELRDVKFRDAPHSDWLQDPWEGIY